MKNRFPSSRPLPLLLLLPLVPVVAAGCVGDPKYSNGFHNSTSDELDGVTIRWGEGRGPRKDEAGILMPGASAESGFGPRPIPQKESVAWRTADGKAHEQTVEVASRVRDAGHFNGTIWFVFTDRGVKVMPRTESELKERVLRGLPLWPE